jgi:integrase
MSPHREPSTPVRAPKLLEQVRQAVRLRHYSPRTEESYVAWIRRYVRFHALCHPRELGAAAVTRFLASLAEAERLSASSQTQALSALLFLYKEVLHRPLESVMPIPRAKQPVRLPVVLDRDEVRLLLARLVGPPRIAGFLMYGSGLRLLEALHLRVKDVDFGMGEIVVRRAKGGKDRVTMLPGAAVPELKAHLERVRRVHQRDLADGGDKVALPGAYEREVASRGAAVVVAVRVPRPPPLCGRARGRRRSALPPPPARVRRSTRRQAGRVGCRPHETDYLS